jgi:methylated-DNA-[protein]-cysteine S-methyltransferase
MQTIFYTKLKIPIGCLLIASSDRGLVRIILPNKDISNSFDHLRKDFPGKRFEEDREKNQKAVEQLEEYFNGTRTNFSLKLDLIKGTEFQKSVWKAVSRIPHGQTSSYGKIARQIGKPKACRAVGLANKRNPVPIVIPCHRIIGSDGSMTGYSGGILLKEKLLKLEQNSKLSSEASP